MPWIKGFEETGAIMDSLRDRLRGVEMNGKDVKYGCEKSKGTCSGFASVSLAVIVLLAGLAWNICAGIEMDPSRSAPSNADIVIFAPHPDDEALCCSGVIYDVPIKGEVLIVYMTSGDGYENANIIYENKHPKEAEAYDRDNDGFDMVDYGYMRKDEASLAMTFLGLEDDNLVWLGYPDGQLSEVYGEEITPVRSDDTSQTSVPYEFAKSYDHVQSKGADYVRGSVMSDIKEILSTENPKEIYVPHERDTHRDHSITYYFVTDALRELGMSPSVHKYLVHWEYSGDSSRVPEIYTNEIQWLTKYLHGNQYDRNDFSNIDTSIRYDKGILLNPVYDAWTVYGSYFVPSDTTSLTIGISYSDPGRFFGNGPTLELWNWVSYQWESVAENIGLGEFIDSETIVSGFSDYISKSGVFGGLVKIRVYDSLKDITDIALVYAYGSHTCDGERFSAPEGLPGFDKEISFDAISFTQNEKLNIINKYVSQIDMDGSYLRAFAKSNEGFWSEDSEGFTFVQLTDLHVGEPWNCEICDGEFQNVEERIRSVVSEINSMDPSPDFVVVTGDLVDSLSTKTHPVDPNPFAKENMETLAKILEELDVDFYLGAGNHDYRLFNRHLHVGPAPTTVINPLHFATSATEMSNQVSEHLDVAPEQSPDLDHYYFDHQNSHFVYLNSGEDDLTSFVGDWGLPESAGPKSGEEIWLENHLDSLDGQLDGKDSSGKIKFLFIHSPLVNGYPELGDGGPSDESMRSELVRIVSEYGVSMVLSGHTHESRELNEYGSSYGSRTWDESNGPMFSQTRAALDYGYRTVSIRNGRVNTYSNVFKSCTKVYLASSANLHAYELPSYDHVGWEATSGEVDVEIDDSYYWHGNDEYPQVISVPYGPAYRIVAEGFEVGTFDMVIEHSLESGGIIKIFYENVPTSPSSVAYVEIRPQNPGFTLHNDLDGDGNYETDRNPSRVEGDSTTALKPPTADAGSDLVGREGEPLQLDGTRSQPNDGEIIEYKWTFNGHTLYGPTPTFVWYDNCVVTVTLTITYRITYTEINNQGKLVTKTRIGTSSDTLTVTILNVNPTSSIDRAYMYVDFTWRVSGEKWHNANLTLYEYDKIGEGNFENMREMFHSEIERYPGDPDNQAVTVYDVYIDMEKRYCTEATFDPYEDDNPISGQLWGSNPVWIDLTFEDGSTERIHHNFNVQQSLVRDSEHWVHIEPWCVDLSPWFVDHWVTFEATATDQGTDDLTLSWDFGDGSNQTNTSFHPFRPSEPYTDSNGNGIYDSSEPFTDTNGNGVWDNGPTDPYPSPYDQNEGHYRPVVKVKVWHVYTFEDDFIVRLTVTDDDNHNQGIGEDTLDIEAIHTDHDCSTR